MFHILPNAIKTKKEKKRQKNLEKIAKSYQTNEPRIRRGNHVKPVRKIPKIDIPKVNADDMILLMRKETADNQKRKDRKKKTYNRLKKMGLMGGSRKHSGINKQTGKLKKGYKYSGKRLKSGLPQIIKI